jgi:hypothetical protein
VNRKFHRVCRKDRPVPYGWMHRSGAMKLRGDRLGTRSAIVSRIPTRGVDARSVLGAAGTGLWIAARSPCVVRRQLLAAVELPAAAFSRAAREEFATNSCDRGPSRVFSSASGAFNFRMHTRLFRDQFAARPWILRVDSNSTHRCAPQPHASHTSPTQILVPTRLAKRPVETVMDAFMHARQVYQLNRGGTRSRGGSN